MTLSTEAWPELPLRRLKRGCFRFVDFVTLLLKNQNCKMFEMNCLEAGINKSVGLYAETSTRLFVVSLCSV